MLCTISSMPIEFLFEQSVGCAVKCKWGATHATNPEATIDIETSGTLKEKLDLGAREFKRLFGCRIKNVSGSDAHKPNSTQIRV